jgi:hypothetical protein
MNDNQKALELLDRIFYSWDIVAPGREGEDLRAPGSLETAEQSMLLIKQLDELNITDSDLESAKESYREVLANYFADNDVTENDFKNRPEEKSEDFLPGANKDKRRIEKSKSKSSRPVNLKFPNAGLQIIAFLRSAKLRHALFSLIVLLAFCFFLNHSASLERVSNYEPDMFSLETAGYLQKSPKILSQDEQNASPSIILPEGSHVIPLGRAANNFVHAKTESGYQGFVHISHLRAGRYIVNKKTARFYESPKANAYKIMPQDTLVLLKPEASKAVKSYQEPLKIKHPDGNIYYLRKHEFYYSAAADLPEIDSQFRIMSSLSRISRHIGESSINELQDRYGPASAILPSESGLMVHFMHLTLNSDGYLFAGLSFRADSLGRIMSLEIPPNNRKPSYARFPGFEQVCSLEFGRFFLSSYYEDPLPVVEFFERFRDSGWFVSALFWLLRLAAVGFVFFLLLSLPHFAAYFTVSLIRIFWPNKQVLVPIYTFLSLFLSYFLFLISAAETGAWFWNLLFIGFVYLFWQRRYRRKFGF